MHDFYKIYRIYGLYGMILLRRKRGDEKVRLEIKTDKNCDREVQLRICAGKLFLAVGSDIENELSTQRRRERGKM